LDSFGEHVDWKRMKDILDKFRRDITYYKVGWEPIARFVKYLGEEVTIDGRRVHVEGVKFMILNEEVPRDKVIQLLDGIEERALQTIDYNIQYEDFKNDKALKHAIDRLVDKEFYNADKEMDGFYINGYDYAKDKKKAELQALRKGRKIVVKEDSPSVLPRLEYNVAEEDLVEEPIQHDMSAVDAKVVEPHPMVISEVADQSKGESSHHEHQEDAKGEHAPGPSSVEQFASFDAPGSPLVGFVDDSLPSPAVIASAADRADDKKEEREVKVEGRDEEMVAVGKEAVPAAAKQEGSDPVLDREHKNRLDDLLYQEELKRARAEESARHLQEEVGGADIGRDPAQAANPAAHGEDKAAAAHHVAGPTPSFPLEEHGPPAVHQEPASHPVAEAEAPTDALEGASRPVVHGAEDTAARANVGAAVANLGGEPAAANNQAAAPRSTKNIAPAGDNNAGGLARALIPPPAPHGPPAALPRADVPPQVQVDLIDRVEGPHVASSPERLDSEEGHVVDSSDEDEEDAVAAERVRREREEAEARELELLQERERVNRETEEVEARMRELLEERERVLREREEAEARALQEQERVRREREAEARERLVRPAADTELVSEVSSAPQVANNIVGEDEAEEIVEEDGEGAGQDDPEQRPPLETGGGSSRTGSRTGSVGGGVATVFEFYEESSEDEATPAVAVPAAASEPVTVKGDGSGANAFASIPIGFLVLSLLLAF
jgi:hypothetical protein